MDIFRFFKTLCGPDFFVGTYIYIYVFETDCVDNVSHGTNDNAGPRSVPWLGGTPVGYKVSLVNCWLWGLGTIIMQSTFHAF